MDWKAILAILAAVATVVGTAYAIYESIRRRRHLKLSLYFNLGLESDDVDRLKIKTKEVSTVLYGVDLSKSDFALTFLPLVLENLGHTKISNLRLQLTYSLKNAPPEPRLLEAALRNRVRFFKGFFEDRNVQTLGSAYQVSIDLHDLRPGEKIIAGDNLRCSSTAISIQGRANNFEYETGEHIARHLRDINEFYDFCVVDVFLYADELPPVSRRLNVVWMSVTDLESLRQSLIDVLPAFWNGELPKPGHYIKFPWEELIAKRIGILIIPDVGPIHSSKIGRFLVENASTSERGIATLYMPDWNYYQHRVRIDNLRMAERLQPFLNRLLGSR